MKDLSRFCISAQCENICRELNNFQNNREVDNAIIDSSFEIISFCFKMCSNRTDQQLVPSSINEQLLPFIVELFHGKKNDEIIRVVESVSTAIDCAKNKKQGDITPAIKFFRDIEDVCFSQSIYSEHSMVTL